MTATERFVALLVGIVAILGGIGGMTRLLWLISWKLSRIVGEFEAHVKSDDLIHADVEQRLRIIEHPNRRR